MTDRDRIDPTGGLTRLPRPFLVVTKGLRAGQVFALQRPAIIIGRADDVDVVVPDRAVSTVHAIIRVDPDGVASIQDLRSTNGTRVNGRRITATHVLEEADEISIGAGTALTFTRDPAAVERLKDSSATK